MGRDGEAELTAPILLIPRRSEPTEDLGGSVPLVPTLIQGLPPDRKAGAWDPDRDPQQGRQQLTVGGRGSGLPWAPSQLCLLGGLCPWGRELPFSCRKGSGGAACLEAMCPQLPDLDKSCKLSVP